MTLNRLFSNENLIIIVQNYCIYSIHAASKKLYDISLRRSYRMWFRNLPGKKNRVARLFV